MFASAGDDPSVSQSVSTITEKAPSRAFFWLKALLALSHLRHYLGCLLRIFTLSIHLSNCMVVIFSCSDVYIKLQVVADTRLDGGTEEQRHERAETCSCNECSVFRLCGAQQ